MDLFPMHAWHPMIVHFPLGLLLGGAAVEAAGWLARRPPLRRAGLVLMCAGVLLTLPAIATGLIAYGRVDHSDASHALMTFHRNLMLTAVGLFGVLLTWRWKAGERAGATPMLRLLYGTLLAAAAATLVVGADRGAALVYGHAAGIASRRLEEVLHERGSEHGHGVLSAGESSEAPLEPGPDSALQGGAGDRNALEPEDSVAPGGHDDSRTAPHTH